jgi:hypothetical protein
MIRNVEMRHAIKSTIYAWTASICTLTCQRWVHGELTRKGVSAVQWLRQKLRPRHRSLPGQNMVEKCSFTYTFD